MSTAIGVVVSITGLIAWVGQSISFLAPAAAEKFGVLEAGEDIDPALSIVEAKAEGLADMLFGWALPASALLMLLHHPLWPYLALFGGGVFLYFSTLITLSRVFLKQAGLKVGKPSAVNAAYLFGGIWALSAVAMIVLAAIHLSS